MKSTNLPDCESHNCQKYKSSNPIVQYMVGRFLDNVVHIVKEQSPDIVVDAGCGEGVVAKVVCDAVPELKHFGFDRDPEAITAARASNPELKFAVRNLFEEPSRYGAADLVLCLEVLEHVDQPVAALDAIMKWTSDAVLLSVPWEPFFRWGNLLRGKYVGSGGDHPDHVQHYDQSSFSQLLATAGGSYKVWGVFPWLFGLVRVEA